MALASVLFPDPLAPRMAATSPGPTETSIPLMTGSREYPAASARVWSTGSGRRGMLIADKVGLGEIGIRPDVAHRAVDQDAALGHGNHAVAQPFHEGQLMLHQDHGEALAAQLLEVGLDGQGHAAIDAGQRFVE